MVLENEGIVVSFEDEKVLKEKGIVQLEDDLYLTRINGYYRAFNKENKDIPFRYIEFGINGGEKDEYFF